MKDSLIRSTVVAMMTLTCAAAASAHEYAGLIRAEKFAEVERAASARLLQEPNHHDALIAKTEAIMGTGVERVEEAIKLGEQCVATHPKESDCYESLGTSLGAKAVNAGIMSAVGSIGKMRDSFTRAVELDPKNLNARFYLMQLYAQTPGIVGGSTSKAKEVMAETAKLNPEAGKLMQAILELSDDQPGKAETIALAVNPGSNEVLREQLLDTLQNIGAEYLKSKKYSDSERVFRVLGQKFPESELGAYGLGRCEQEQGKHQAAVALFEKASTLTPTPRARVLYRLAVSQQALGDKPKAILSLEKALAIKPALSKKLTEEAQAKLKLLKS